MTPDTYTLTVPTDDMPAILIALREYALRARAEDAQPNARVRGRFARITALRALLIRQRIDQDRTAAGLVDDDPRVPLDTPSLDTSFHDHEMDV